MKVRYQADNDLKKAIVKGVKRLEPAIDFRSAQSAGLDGMNDLDVLNLAAREGRILVSHDVTTMTVSLRKFLHASNSCPGVFLVPQYARIGSVIDSLVFIWEESEPDEWEGCLRWLPL